MEQRTDYATSKAFARLLHGSRSYGWWYALLLLLVIFAAASGVGFMDAIRRIVSGATTNQLEPVFMGVALAVGVTIAKASLHIAQTRVMATIKNASTTKLQYDTLHQMSRKRMQALDMYHSSDLAARVLNAAVDAQSGLNDKMLILLANAVQVVMAMMYFSWLNVTLTLGLILFTLLYPALTYPISRRLRMHYDKRGDEIADKEILLQEVIQSSEEVRTYSLQTLLYQSLSKKLNRVLSRSLTISLLERLFEFFNRIATFGGMVFILSVGGLQVMNGQLEVGALAVFVVTSGQLTNPLRNISKMYTDMIESVAQAQRVFTIADLPEERDTVPDINTSTSAPEAGAARTVKAAIAFNQVQYAYGTGKKVLENISFQVNRGETVALVGASGSGKSTILKLLLRLYVPEQGEIHAYGEPLEDGLLDQWRQDIGYVSQDALIFSGTVREHICFGTSGATIEEIIAAARLAHIHERIAALPLGYDTLLGERGIQLSGGELQRLSLARAYLRSRPCCCWMSRPPLWILTMRRNSGNRSGACQPEERRLWLRTGWTRFVGRIKSLFWIKGELWKTAHMKLFFNVKASIMRWCRSSLEGGLG